MSAWAWVALSFVPGLAVVAWHLRERARLRRLTAEREADRKDTLLFYVASDREKAKRESFSNWPFPPR